MDLDLALRADSPALVTDLSTSDQKREFERWERSNRMCMMIIKRAITTTKAFLTDIEKRFVKIEKAEIGTILITLISMR